MGNRGRPKHPDILTPREWEVLALLREGLSNEEIAERLGVSLAGAKYHVSEILSKLGVSSRDEASRWSPERRPWWAVAFAPLTFVWRKASTSWAAGAAAAGVFVLTAAGIGVLVWGLVRTGEEHSQRTTSAQPISTDIPFLASRIDCPGGLASPEDAIRSCLAGETYVGPCGIRERQDLTICSVWDEGVAGLRAYILQIPCPDCFRWMIVSHDSDGWQVTHRAFCGAQGVIDVRGDIVTSGGDASVVRSDDCTVPPPPFPRPEHRVGPFEGQAFRIAGNKVGINGASYFPERGIRLDIWIAAGSSLSWQASLPMATLIAVDGTETSPSEYAGFLIGVDTGRVEQTVESVSGWLVFPVEPGQYKLRIPGDSVIDLDLTGEDYNDTLTAYYTGGKPDS